MTTFNDLVEAVRQNLFGFTVDQEQYATLSGAINASVTSLTTTAATATEVTRGLIEIEDELIWVLSVAQTTGVVTVLPGGRGFSATTAATHADQTPIINNPKFPRVAIKRAINDTIKAVYPYLFKVSTTTLTKSAAVYSYGLPAATGDILSIRADTVGPTQIWSPVRSWSFNASANTTDFANGKSIDIMDSITPGRTIQVTYSAAPTELSSNSDVFASVTGLPSSAEDVVTYGACYRLLPALEAARLQQDAIEQSERAQNVQSGSAASASRYYYTLYKQRLDEEAAKLRALYPAMVHYTW